MKSLTKAEEQIMQILWELKEGVVKDIVDKFDDPKPAYTTVATVLTVLEKKGFVTCKKIGNVKLYFPIKNGYGFIQIITVFRAIIVKI